jgi:hypothetical protein
VHGSARELELPEEQRRNLHTPSAHLSAYSARELESPPPAGAATRNIRGEGEASFSASLRQYLRQYLHCCTSNASNLSSKQVTWAPWKRARRHSAQASRAPPAHAPTSSCVSICAFFTSQVSSKKKKACRAPPAHAPAALLASVFVLLY